MLRDGAFLGILFLLSFLDLSVQRIPDRILLSAIINYLLGALLSMLPIRTVLWHLATGFLLGIGLLIVTLFIEKLFQKECLGGGDIKLLCVVCLYLGFWHTLYALAIACGSELFTLFVNRKNGAFPFAPAITGGVCIVLFFL